MRSNISWKGYGNSFKLVYTPRGRQTGKWEKGQISIVTPENGDAWREWPEVSKEDLSKFKNKWNEIQKNLSDDKYNQILKHSMNFDKTVDKILKESQFTGPIISCTK